ncbi:tyrosine-type recombinase/integrase [Streptomyces sp. CGMCC 4.7035]|nr:tyrosine-type recombinase/integrase [Streptomyces sp. CGMCC 4.7035]WNC00028.1 tyrosine-type recombinase/integrase [Streptomyces sp. CGMCC 4.7035]
MSRAACRVRIESSPARRWAAATARMVAYGPSVWARWPAPSPRRRACPCSWPATPVRARCGGPARLPYYHIHNQWKRIKRAGEVDILEGMVIYGLRHFFASNCLTHGTPITDVAEWMGHNSLDITFKVYRHLMPGSIGKAAKALDLGLTT